MVNGSKPWCTKRLLSEIKRLELESRSMRNAQYPIKETIIVKETNFENLDRLSKTIEEAIVHLSNQLIQEIIEVDSRE